MSEACMVQVVVTAFSITRFPYLHKAARRPIWEGIVPVKLLSDSLSRSADMGHEQVSKTIVQSTEASQFKTYSSPIEDQSRKELDPTTYFDSDAIQLLKWTSEDNE